MQVFGEDEAPHGHMHLRFTDVRVPESNILLGEGRGFEISQVRLGPGRIHHCMRSIGAAERALELMVRRGLNREAFGKPLARLGKNTEVIAKARIEIEAMRLMVLRAAKAMDTMGNAEARVWVSAVKAMVPVRVCQIIDEAIQIHGATGVSQWTPLARMYAGQRTLRLADGPDEVHWHVVGRAELTRYEDDHAPLVVPRNHRRAVLGAVAPTGSGGSGGPQLVGLLERRPQRGAGAGGVGPAQPVGDDHPLDHVGQHGHPGTTPHADRHRDPAVVSASQRALGTGQLGEGCGTRARSGHGAAPPDPACGPRRRIGTRWLPSPTMMARGCDSRDGRAEPAVRAAS